MRRGSIRDRETYVMVMLATRGCLLVYRTVAKREGDGDFNMQYLY